MITVLFYCTGKPGSDKRLHDLLVEMTRVSRTEDQAVNYTFLQQADAPTEWALFEQWRSKEHLGAHMANMKKHFGEPPAGARLPARMHELVEKSRAVFYTVVE